MPKISLARQEERGRVPAGTLSIQIPWSAPQRRRRQRLVEAIVTLVFHLLGSSNGRVLRPATRALERSMKSIRNTSVIGALGDLHVKAASAGSYFQRMYALIACRFHRARRVHATLSIKGPFYPAELSRIKAYRTVSKRQSVLQLHRPSSASGSTCSPSISCG